MDSVTKTTQNAYVNYFEALRRFGNITKQDKYKLLVLWFFYYLKYKSDFLYQYANNTEDRFVWNVDRTLENFVNAKFMSQIDCLTTASCFIKMSQYSDCVPVIEKWWRDMPNVPEQVFQFLVTNATNVIAQHNVEFVTNDDFEKLNDFLWTNDSGIMTSGSSDNTDSFLNINEERNE